MKTIGGKNGSSTSHKPIKLTVRTTNSKNMQIIKSEGDDDWDETENAKALKLNRLKMETEERVKAAKEKERLEKLAAGISNELGINGFAPSGISSQMMAPPSPMTNKQSVFSALHNSKPVMSTLPPSLIGSDLLKAEEKNFIKILHEFMNDRLTPIPKLIWMGLRDGEF